MKQLYDPIFLNDSEFLQISFFKLFQKRMKPEPNGVEMAILFFFSKKHKNSWRPGRLETSVCDNLELDLFAQHVA